MADTTPMRERMIAALDNATTEWVKSQGGDKGMADMPTEVLVDAMLAVLETPSDMAINTVLDESSKVYGHTYNAWGPIAWHFTAMVKAIRGGA